MTNATWNFHMLLIRLAKGAIKGWETWLRQSSNSTELPRANSDRLTEAAHLLQDE